jgi:DNA-binding YbaB/EbfC family protein
MSGMGNLNQLMKQAQQMQAKLAEAQKKIEELTLSGTSGGGMVTIDINGKGNILKVNIDPKLLEPSEGEIISDLIVAAYADAKGKLETQMESEMSGIMPQGMKLPF